MTKSYSGKFKPSYPGKYKGDPTNIIYRSLWERKFMVRPQYKRGGVGQ